MSLERRGTLKSSLFIPLGFNIHLTYSKGEKLQRGKMPLPVHMLVYSDKEMEVQR